MKKIKMKKILIVLLSLIFTISFAIFGIGCKEEVPAEEVTEEEVEEETEEEVAEEVEEEAAEEEMEEEEAEMVTLKFLDMWTEMEDVMLESIARFQAEYPNVEVIRDPTPWDEAETVLKTNIAGGTPYDVATYWPMYMRTFVELDAAMDLTDAIDSDPEWKSGIEGLLDLGKVDGKVYAVPFKSIYAVTFYNKGIFDEYGLSEPVTIDEFEKAMQTIKEEGVAPFTNFDGAMCWLPRFMMPAFADEAGVLDEFIAGEIDASDPDYRHIYKKPFEIILDWYEKGYFYGGKGAAGISRDEVKAAFSNEEVAMFNETTSEYGSITEISDFDVNVFKFPSVVDPPQYYFFGGADGFFASSETESPEMAIAFLKFMDSPEIQKLWLEEKGITPVNTAVEIEDPVILRFVDWSQYLQPFELYSLSAEISSYLDASVGELLTGAKTPDEIVDDINDLRGQL